MVHQQAYRAAVGGKHRASKTIINFGIVRRPFVAAAVLFLVSISGSPSQAQSGPFAAMAGSWSGGGTVNLEDGSTERIRCRARYAPAGPTMSMSLNCASDAYKFILSAEVAAEGNAITGNWTESSRNVSGTLQGRRSGGNFQVHASAAGFNANLSLATRGNKQTVSIRGDGQFRGANIALSR